MNYDMADWETAADKLLERLAAGAWRHGLKTEDAQKEVARYGRFPADPNTALPPRWQKKYGDLIKLGLYYYVQGRLKNAYHTRIGKSGDLYRVRRFYSVPHGRAEDEKDENGKPQPASKHGLWLREEDLNPADIGYLATKYRAREEDASPVKRYLWKAEEKSQGLPKDGRLGDILDDILDDM